MISESSAREIARQHVASMRLDTKQTIVLQEEPVLTGEFGWAFVFNSSRFFETRNPLDAVVGAGPIIVRRETGEVIETGSAHSLEWHIANLPE